MTDNYDQLALSWVRKEINNTLDQARQGLENFAEDHQDQTQIQFCINCLHQVQGTLQMLEFSGAAKLAEEMENLAEKMSSDSSYSNEASFEVLMRALLQMPGYLERVEDGHKDVPVILLPLINEVRAAGNLPPMPESELFTADTHSVTPPKAQEKASETDRTSAFQDNTKKLRAHFQKGLTGVIRGENIKESLARIHKVLLRLEALTEGYSVARLWWVADGFIFSIMEKGLYKKKEIHQLLAKVDKQIKRLSENGASALSDVIPEELLSQLLYYVARSNSKNQRVLKLKKEFSLDGALADSEQIKKRQEKLAQPDTSAVTNVAGAINEELQSVKDQLDLFVRAQSKDPSILQNLINSLIRIADTLTLLELAIPRDVIRQQIKQIQDLLDSNSMPGDSVVMDIAGALLFVEANLKNINLDVSGEIATEEESAERSENQAKESQVDEATQALIKVARKSMQAAKDRIINYIASGFDRETLAEVPTLLDEVLGGVRIVQFDTAAQFLQIANDFVEKRIIAVQSQPKEEHLDALADVITSVEYYLEASEEGKHRGIDSILKGATESSEILSTALASELPVVEEEEPVEEQQLEAVVESQQVEEVSTQESAEVIPILSLSAEKEVDETLIDEEVLEIFLEEAEEEVQAIDAMLPRWINNVHDDEAITTLRRSFHTLKGSGRLVGAKVIGEVSWAVENMLNRVLEETIPAETPVISVLNEAHSMLPQLVEAFSKQTPVNCDYQLLIAKAEHVAAGRPLSEFDFEQKFNQSDEVIEAGSQEAIDPVLLEIFSTEAESHIQNISSFINSAPAEGTVAVTDELIRALHTLKGSAHMAGVEAIAKLTGPCEKYARLVKGSGARFEQSVILLLKQICDFLDGSLQNLKSAEPFDESELNKLVEKVVQLDIASGATGDAGTSQRDQRLVSIFLTEGLDILHELSHLNQSLVSDPDNASLKESIRMELHTFHRGSEMVAISELEKLACAAENLASHYSQLDTIEKEFNSLLSEVIEKLTTLLNKIASEEDLDSADSIIGQIEDWISGSAGEAEPEPEDMDVELVELFVEEGEELIETARQLLNRWVDNLNSKEINSDLRRIYHTLKGSSRMAGAMNIGDLAHAAEDIFNTVIDFARELSVVDQEIVVATTNKLETMVAELKKLRWPAAADKQIQIIRHHLDPESRAVESPAISEVVDTGVLENISVSDTFSEVVQDEVVEPLIPDEPEEKESNDSEEFTLDENIAEVSDGDSEELIIEDIAANESAPEEYTLDSDFVLPTETFEENIPEEFHVEDVNVESSSPEEYTIDSDFGVPVEIPEESISEDIIVEDVNVDSLSSEQHTLDNDFIDGIDADEISDSGIEPEDVLVTEDLVVSDDIVVSEANLINESSVKEDTSDELTETDLIVDNLEDKLSAPEEYTLDNDFAEAAQVSDSSLVADETVIADDELVVEENSIEAETVTPEETLVEELIIEDVSVQESTLENEFLESVETSDDIISTDLNQIHGELNDELDNESHTLERNEEKVPDDVVTNLESANIVNVDLDEDGEEVLDIYLEEVEELMLSLDEALLNWSESSTDKTSLDLLQRTLHTFKGGARLSELVVLGDLTHEMETYFERVSAGQLAVEEGDINFILRGYDVIAGLVNEVKEKRQMTVPVSYMESLHSMINRKSSADITTVIPLVEADVNQPAVTAGSESVSSDNIEPSKPIVVSGKVHQCELDEDGEEVLEIYLEEVEELLISLDEALHDWSETLDDKNTIDLLQRTLHTFKGGARLTDLVILGDLTHEMETYFERVNSGQLTAKAGDVDFLLQGYDVIARLIKEVKEKRQMTLPEDYMIALRKLTDGQKITEEKIEETHPESEKQDEESIAEVVSFEEKKQEVENRQKQSKASDIIRVPSEQLENLVNLAGETSIFRSRLEQQMSVLRYNLEEMSSTVERLREQLRNLDIETDAQISYRREVSGGEEYEDFDPLEMDRYTRQQELTRGLSESSVDLMSLKEALDSLTADSETLLLQQGRVNSEMQESLMRTRMIPFESLVPRLRRMVRQISTELGKTIALQISADGEMDRSVLERMIAPLEHMLRNAMDHGIESPEERRAGNKSEKGSINISLYREGSEVFVKISDDGRGLNLQAIRRKAIDKGLISESSDLSDHELQQLILEAGFSTAEQVTQISGRGVGLDVVSSEIKQMGGVVEIDSLQGVGTTFTVKLPFTVSVNHALMVQLGEEVFAIPLANIEGIVRVSPFELEEYYSNDETSFEYAGIDYSMNYLGKLLDHTRDVNLKDVTQPLPVLLLHGADHPTALQVDELLGSREIVVKSIGSQLSSISGLSGATILGDGRVVLILDMPALIRHIDAKIMTADELLLAGEEAVRQDEDRVPVVMVVDDSITVRKVTTRLLERHDFEVITAKDGVDALSVLSEHKPDVMLLDIEMPRMDGFELATIIRHDDEMKELPIIMITSRTGEKHRERAEQIGVNQYMGKPYNEVDLIESISALLPTIA